MEFRDLVERAMTIRERYAEMTIRERYAEMESTRYGRSWSRQELALGLVGDLGDLAKLIQAKEGIRSIPNADEKLAHELADCLWSVVVLARLYGVDLEAAFFNTMNDLEGYLEST